jgi:hypothetical protein
MFLPASINETTHIAPLKGYLGPFSPKIIGKNIDLNVLKRGKTTKNTFATTMERRSALVLH